MGGSMNPKFMAACSDPTIEQLLRAILLPMGCEIEACTAAEALAAAADPEITSRYDALFLEDERPLAALPPELRLPLILVSKNVKHTEVIRAYRGGAAYQLPKPFTRDQVFFALDLLFAEPGGAGRHEYRISLEDEEQAPVEPEKA